MINQQYNIDVISNNLANINTSGFKKSEISFKDLNYKKINNGESSFNEIGLGSGIGSIKKNFSQGVLKETGNPLDLAIDGKGFFKIKLSDGSAAYTRDGSFRLNGEGEIVNADGYYLEPSITIPEEYSEVSISEDGIISVKSETSDDTSEIGKISLYKFNNPSGLKNIAGNLFQETDASGPAGEITESDSSIKIIQNFLETSNINVIEEMVNMIAAQRAYEINSKAVKASDEMMEMANSVRR